MAIAYVNVASNNVAANTITINKPTDTADNDILLAFGYCFNNVTGTPTISYPGGWTQITTNALNASTNRLGWWAWKRASGEGADYTFTGETNTTNMSGVILAYRGCITTDTPYDQLSNTNYVTSDLYLVAASITPTVSPSMAVFMGVSRSVFTAGAIDNSFTEKFDQVIAGFQYAAERTLSDTSAVGTTTVTATGTATPNKHAIMVNLKEPAGAPAFTGLTVKHYLTG